MIVIVAEKPDVGNKIAAALDKITLRNGQTISFAQLKTNEKSIKVQQAKDGYLKIQWQGQETYVTWGFGHLCELKQAYDYNPAYRSWNKMPLPFFPDDYEIRVKNVANDAAWEKRVHEQFDRVCDLMCKASLLINATDFDREGEVIFSYIYELSRSKAPVKRACFSSQTKDGIRDGFGKDLKDGVDMQLIDAAGRMRSIADWVVGANLTAAMTLKMPNQGVFSVGRVQTPTLALLVEKELSIRNFIKSPYWTLEAQITAPSGETFKADHKTKKFTDKKQAEAVYKKINGNPVVITAVKNKSESKDPPSLYNLSALQMEANSKYGMTLEQVLTAAQSLYDNGYTTYPRTNSQFLTQDMPPVIEKVLAALEKVSIYAPLIQGRRAFDQPKLYYNDKKVESHFAIIPTGEIPKGLNETEKKVYDLICRSVIKAAHKPAILNRTHITASVSGEDFTASGTSIKERGWMVVGDTQKSEMLPSLKQGDICDATYELKAKQTEPPKRYTDKSLLAAMLSAGKLVTDAELKKVLSDPKVGGIGTEATRAAIVKTLLDRGYIQRSGKALSATEKGIRLIQDLPLDEVKSPEMTARWEQRLNNIASGDEDPTQFLADIHKAIESWIKMIGVHSSSATSAMLSTVRCPNCGGEIKPTKFGYGCAEWRTGCKFTINAVICQKTIPLEQIVKLLSDGKTDKMDGFVSKAGKKFSAAFVLKDGKAVFDFS